MRFDLTRLAVSPLGLALLANFDTIPPREGQHGLAGGAGGESAEGAGGIRVSCGTVTGLEAGSLTVALLEDGSLRAFALSRETVVRLLGQLLTGQRGRPELRVGQRVIVLTERGSDCARLVLVENPALADRLFRAA